MNTIRVGKGRPRQANVCVKLQDVKFKDVKFKDPKFKLEIFMRINMFILQFFLLKLCM